MLNAYPSIKFSVKVIGDSAMLYRIEEKEAMRIVGTRIPLTKDMDENQKIVPSFWTRVLQSSKFTEICKLSNQSPDGVLGVTVY